MFTHGLANDPNTHSEMVCITIIHTDYSFSLGKFAVTDSIGAVIVYDISIEE